MTALVADIGGTNTRVALCDTPDAPREIARFRNAEFGALDAVLRHYLAGLGETRITEACVAVAGPVRGGVGRMTNLDWTMDAATLRAATGAARGFVINDLEAQGHALEDVPTRRLMGTANADRTEARLVVGLGTGFNAAPVHAVRGQEQVHVVPSECGHISLPVWNDATVALAGALADRHGFASVEEALSGRGLLAVNAHVAGSCAHATTQDLLAALNGAPSAQDHATADLFCRILGRVLGDLALVHLPWGGIYLIGGLARAMAPFFDSHGLPEAFHDKGRFGPFMRDFSLWLVEDDYSALTGCARYARRHA
ncbi:glucokinase [Meridianimarinicoccus roseus]|uniref:Glucokinase n=1 Tax=Meridianimarinicoccus roseus TaxID=2072018 RepID=A0A2V2LC71_9RHOB|nr:glucokinase [Meridianimarinicoccus roseus]PWR03120.1 glucokinase [Meridianimarinicoccus roseus]